MNKLCLTVRVNNNLSRLAATTKMIDLKASALLLTKIKIDDLFHKCTVLLLEHQRIPLVSTRPEKTMVPKNTGYVMEAHFLFFRQKSSYSFSPKYWGITA